MAAFEYRAQTTRGKIKKGVLEADTARQIRQQLREQGLIPLEITASQESERRQSEGIQFFKKKISASELALITRQLATLVESGLPIEEGLLAVAEQCDKPRMKSMMMAVRSKVTEGFSLADSLAEFPHVFDNLFRSMVAAGEKSGHLDSVLERLADYTEQRQYMRSQIMQALLYPGILTFFGVAVIGILLAFVVPKIVEQFEHMGESLPASTQWLIASSDFIRDYGLIVILLILAGMVLFQRLMQKDSFCYRMHTFQLQMPILGKVNRGLNTSRFARTLSILTASAVPLLESMQIAGQVLDNTYIKQAVKEAAGRVREGASLRSALSKSNIFPPMMLHMIASGEKSGELESMLARAADQQDREFENLVSVSLKLFEPALMAAMAVIVFLIVLAIIQPILKLNNLVGM